VADPLRTLNRLVSAAMVAALGDAAGETPDPVLRRSSQERFGDYQANFAMALAKRLDLPPRQVAERVAAELATDGVLAKVEVAGPGFLNLTLDDAFIAGEVEAALDDTHFGVPRAEASHRFVVDYAGPNVAKEMHVGHLRSSVIGDALVRVLEWLGHDVLRQDHLGDWGTQFGMLIEHLADLGWAAEPGAEHHIGDLDDLYRQANEKFGRDPDFAERGRRRVVALQRGDQDTRALWDSLVAESRRHFSEVYRRLGLTLSDADSRPESFYNDMLDDVVEELTAKGLLRVDDGALCAFPPGFTSRDGSPLPLIVRKSDGGYGYQATDLAGIRYSVEELGGDRLVYVVDSGQSQHFAMVFAVARQAGWIDGGASAEHVAFGMVLGPDRKRLRTRTGGSIKLIELLDEAVQRAVEVVEAKSPDLPPAERSAVAEAVGIGAVKYNDLVNDRSSDYIFDWARMLAMDGNTAPYLQYAHARIRSIFRRVQETTPGGAGAAGPVTLAEPAERNLALALAGFDGAVHSMAEHLQPHRLTGYLFELASAFTAFYESCPVLRAPTDELRGSRLALCELTASILAQGLELLGIEAPERM